MELSVRLKPLYRQNIAIKVGEHSDPGATGLLENY